MYIEKKLRKYLFISFFICSKINSKIWVTYVIWIMVAIWVFHEFLKLLKFILNIIFYLSKKISKHFREYTSLESPSYKITWKSRKKLLEFVLNITFSVFNKFSWKYKDEKSKLWNGLKSLEIVLDIIFSIFKNFLKTFHKYIRMESSSYKIASKSLEFVLNIIFSVFKRFSKHFREYMRMEKSNKKFQLISQNCIRILKTKLFY